MKFGSVCSGIEAASCAWHSLGWRAAFLSEIEPFPSAVLAHHYPTVPNRGDMTQFKEWPDAAIDLLVGGTPCQSFSVAGLRKGLADPRGNLMLTYLAIAERYAPRWLVWENVPGVLSSNDGQDFGTLLGGLAELGYGFAYRVLDAQFFGVPQRRRRVFVVARLGDWRAAAAVLFERESLLGHPAPRREPGERIAATLTRGAESSGKGGYAGRRQEDDVNIVPLVAPTLSARTKGGGGLGTDFERDGGLIPGIARALTTSNQRIDAETETLLPISYAIQAGATRENPESGPDGIGVQSNVAYTLEARAEVQAVAFDLNQITSPANRSSLAPGAVPTLAKESRMHAITQPVADTLTANWHESNGATGGNNPGLINPVFHGAAVRRLTPRECERLQGFPDDYTLINVRGKPAADGPRYKALGNSMAVPVMRWIGERIQQVEGMA
ncbi:DNA cytosine methyltransferase [Paraburkholderia azotifigens]